MKPISTVRAWRSILPLLVLLVFQPAFVEAGHITSVTFAFPFAYFDLEFGTELGLARIVDNPIAVFDEDLWGPTEEFEIVGGTFNLVSGPLLDVTPTAWGDAAYTHAGGGSVSIEFDLLLPDGSIHHGTFQAPLGIYTIFPDGVGGGGGTEGYLGAGLFDAGTSQLLGINRHTLSGNASLHLDTYDSYPEPYRVAQAFGYVDVVATVPEPAVLWLIGMAGGTVAFRSRRSNRRTLQDQRRADVVS